MHWDMRRRHDAWLCHLKRVAWREWGLNLRSKKHTVSHGFDYEIPPKKSLPVL
jgi:hypothetical protein